MLSDMFDDLYEAAIFAGCVYNEIFIKDIKTFLIYVYIHTGIAFWNSWL